VNNRYDGVTVRGAPGPNWGMSYPIWLDFENTGYVFELE
jgi:hypothetical protein